MKKRKKPYRGSPAEPERRLASILDIGPSPEHAGRRLVELTRRVEYLEARNELLEDIVFQTLDVAACDYCRTPRPRWFDIPFVEGQIGRGCVNGLLVGGGACCVACLDTLYEIAASYEQDAWDRIAAEVARWLLRYPQNRRASRFGDDPDVREWMRRLSP